MSSSPIIHVEKLGKRYRLGERERYLALRDILARAAAAPARLFRPRKRSSSDGGPTHIWALKDVSFEVPQGQVVGLIGRNGAGKTTLLKILARVTFPTAGFAEVRGRMGSLLEVGTGFHPELNGRENVFLSGAILGMSKVEIQRKFDEIVAFAEVEKFLDTAVKHYSMGMRMRLAFAVAAHLEPEILLVDEVLSVGDLEFQKKCLGKMGKVAEGGRTILFVSHQMNQVRRLCQRVLWIEGGGIRADGPAKLLVNEYEAASLANEDPNSPEARGSILFGSWQVEASGTNIFDLDQGCESVVIKVPARVTKPIRKGEYFIYLKDSNDMVIWSKVYDNLRLDPGPVTFIDQFSSLPLMPGVYTWTVDVHDGHQWTYFGLVPELSIVSAHTNAVGQHFKGVLNVGCDIQVQVGDPTPVSNLVAAEPPSR